MKITSGLNFRALLCAGLLFGALSVRAQQSETARSEVLQRSRQLFIGGDFKSGEKALEEINPEKNGSIAWHVTEASLLLQVGFGCQAEGQAMAAAEAGRRALAEVAQAQRIGSNEKAGTRANWEELTAVIQERLLGDVDGAESHYVTAAQLAPKSGQAADKVSRLNRQHADADAKAKAKKN